MATTFPSSRSISPSVRIEERDFSQYDVGSLSNRTALIGFAAKGPLNVPTEIRNTEELFRVFGHPDPELPSYLIYAAIDYLREGNSLHIVRVGEDDPGNVDFARTAFVDIPSGGVHAQLISGVTQSTWNDAGSGSVAVTLTSPRYIRLRSNGTSFVRELVIPANVQIDKLVEDGTGTSLQKILNDQTTEDDGFYVTSCDTGANARLVFRSKVNGPESSIEIVSSRYNIYNGDSSSGLTVSNTADTDTISGQSICLNIGRKMTYPKAVGTADSFGPSSSAGEWAFGGYRNLRLEVMVYGTGDPSLDGVIQNVYLPADANGDNLDEDPDNPTNPFSTSSLVDWLNGVHPDAPEENSPRGFMFVVNNDTIDIVAAYPNVPIPSGIEEGDIEGWFLTGPEARILVRPTSTADEILGFDNVVQVGTSGQDPVASDPTLCITGDPSSDQKLDTHKVFGSDAVLNTSTMRFHASTPGTEGNYTSVTVEIDPETARINLYIDHRGIRVESWVGLHNDPNDATDPLHYVENYINGYSDYIFVEDDDTILDIPKAGVYTLGSLNPLVYQAGSNGIPVDPDDQSSLIIGSTIRSSGIFSLSETERIDIDLVAVPGVSSTRVISALKHLCEQIRQDCMFIVDPPYGMTPNEVRKWHNGQHPLNNVKFNSNYGALYWPWIKEFDPVNQIDVWTPPSGSVLAVYARTDKESFPWIAPAGLRRGGISWALETEYIPYLTERDSLYAHDNAVNTIVNFPLDGIHVWGQKTLQRRPTALDRVNVRRMLLYAEKTIKVKSRYLLFEPHDAALRDEFTRLASSVMDRIVTNRGAYEYIVICDEVLNTPEVIDRNEMRARIGIKPTKAMEFLFITFSLHRTGADFSTSVLENNPTRYR